MLTQEELEAIQRAAMIPTKRYLTPAEMYLYCGYRKATLYRKLKTAGIFISSTGYYDRHDLDDMMKGAPSKIVKAANKISIK